MISFDAALRLLSPNVIGKTITDIFSDKDRLLTMQETAKTYATGRDAVLDYVWAQLEPLLTEVNHAPA